MPYTAPSARYPERAIPGEDDPSAADYEPAPDPMTVAAMIAKSKQSAGGEEMGQPVVIEQEQWKEPVAGPVPTGGRGIYLRGGNPFVGQPLAPWTIEQDIRNREEEQQQNIREILQSVPPSQQSAMLERATRLQGMLSFQSDIQRGVPFMQAYAKNVPQMYFNSPAASVAAMRTLAGPTQKPVQPFQISETPVSAGTVLRMGGRAQFIPTKKETVTKPETMVRISQNRIAALQKALDATFGDARAPLEKELAEERAEEKRLVTEMRKAKPTATSAVPIGGIYKGYKRIGEDVTKPESWQKVQ